MEIARAEGAFTEVDVPYCELLCDMAGSAVKNAKLHGELRGTLAQYKSLIERLPAITYVDDLETGASEFVSPQIEELFGISQEKWLSSPDAWLTTVHPDDRERARQGYTLRRRRRSRSATSIASCRRRSRALGVDQTVILPGGEGHPSLTQGVIFDITDIKRRRARPDPPRRSRSPHGPAQPRPVPKPARRRAHARSRQRAGRRRPLRRPR